MFSDEIRNTVNIAISAMLLALVLGLIAYVSTIRGDLATARNQEIATSRSLETYREFNKYNKTIIYGEDIIEVIRKYQGTELEIFIDNVSNTGFYYYLNRQNLKNALEQHNPTFISNISFTGANPIGVSELQDAFTPNYQYTSYLVYNSLPVKESESYYMNLDVTGNFTEVTGIAIFYKGTR